MGPGSRCGCRVSSVVVLLASFVVAACSTAAPPAAPVTVATSSPAERSPPAPRPAVPPKPVDLHWAFAASVDLCTALASGQGGSLQIQATPARQVLLTARFTAPARTAPMGARPAKLSFSGAAGAWSVPGTWQRREFTSTQTLDERSVAGVLSLLAGGTAVVTAGPLHLGSARLPSSSGQGREWVQCPKQMMALP